jgi:hypothetical protein
MWIKIQILKWKCWVVHFTWQWIRLINAEVWHPIFTLIYIVYTRIRRYCDGERYQSKISTDPHILSHPNYKKLFFVCHLSICMDVHITSAWLAGRILFILSHVNDQTWVLICNWIYWMLIIHNCNTLICTLYKSLQHTPVFSVCFH